MSPTRPRVAVFSTGGTIASKRSADGAASPNLTAEELVAAVPQLADVANIETGRVNARWAVSRARGGAERCRFPFCEFCLANSF